MGFHSELNITTGASSTGAVSSADLLGLPLHVPLEEWPSEVLAALPRGISRHVVRFAHLSDTVVAVKETTDHAAHREYGLLRQINRLEVPSVEPVAVITGRRTTAGEELPAMLVTQHLRFSLPYRAVFSQKLPRATLIRMVDALALLLVQLHLEGFFWGDVSLSNVLFRRDAGAFAAYLVDAETGELHPRLSKGQRDHDLDLASTNIAGELMDLMAGGLVEPDVDPMATSELIEEAYRALWEELTAGTSFDVRERWRVEDRIRRLNELGFDVEEFHLRTTDGGSTLLLQPKVVDAGHHARRLAGLTGLRVQENQARRLLREIDDYRATRNPGMDEHESAHYWLSEVFEPVTQAIPAHLQGKLEPAEMMHELLEHRWYLSERAERSIDLAEALPAYVRDVLAHRRDEDAVMLHPTTTMLPLVTPLSTDHSPESPTSPNESE